jgi:POT family proton-dependent oligopeptide transporter
MWVWLSKIGKNPSIPMKFGLGLLQLGLGYLVVQFGVQFVSADYQVPLFTLALLYMLHTTGELFISPIGLSMVSKLAPANMTGTVMGAWFLSIAGANYVAALLAKLTGVKEGAEPATAVDSFNTYVNIYTQMGLITIGIGLVLVLLSKPLNKLMHGVK